jgi:hypothetical protein
MSAAAAIEWPCGQDLEASAAVRSYRGNGRFTTPTVRLGACGNGPSHPLADPVSGAPTTSVAPSDLAKVTLRVGGQVNLTQVRPRRLRAERHAPQDRVELVPVRAALAGSAQRGRHRHRRRRATDFSRRRRADIKVVLASETPEANQGILVRPGSTITTVAELEGKKVAVAKGSSANWILLKALQAKHLSVSGIQVVYLQPADASPRSTPAVSTVLHAEALRAG